MVDLYDDTAKPRHSCPICWGAEAEAEEAFAASPPSFWEGSGDRRTSM